MVDARDAPCNPAAPHGPYHVLGQAVQGGGVRCAARSSRSLARSPVQHTPTYWCLFLRSLARSLSARSPALRLLAARSPLVARSLTATHRALVHCARLCDRSLVASSPLVARSFSARSLALWLPHSHTPIHWCHPSARYSGDIPNKLQLPCQCCLVDHLGGFAVGTQMRGISLFPLVP